MDSKQTQMTIFGNEENVKVRAKKIAKSIDLALVIAASEDFCAPCFVPGTGNKGTWYISVDGTGYAYGTGTLLGLTDKLRVHSVDSMIARAIVSQSYAGLLGTALMNGKAIRILPSAPGCVTMASYGILSGTGKPATFRRVNNKWERLGR
jgi:hypothetical protein